MVNQSETRRCQFTTGMFPASPASDAVWWCSVCMGEIYEGDTYYLIDGRTVCTDCLRDFAERYFLRQRRIAEAGR